MRDEYQEHDDTEAPMFYDLDIDAVVSHGWCCHILYGATRGDDTFPLGDYLVCLN